MPESNESHREYPKNETETKPKTYTVDSGDNLSAIAKQELGDANRWREIYELNKDTLKLCLVEAGITRPTEFVGKGKQVLVVFQRTTGANEGGTKDK